MYQVDEKDRVFRLTDIPQSSVGAPIPIVISEELCTTVAFYGQTFDPDWDGTTVRIIDANADDEPIVIVRFSLCYAHQFGAPNDEAFEGHPLHERGLEPYSNFEIVNSSWLRQLEKMNSVHPYHDKESFLNEQRHFVLAFHDSTFECIARDYTVETTFGSIADVAVLLSRQLGS